MGVGSTCGFAVAVGGKGANVAVGSGLGFVGVGGSEVGRGGSVGSGREVTTINVGVVRGVVVGIDVDPGAEGAVDEIAGVGEFGITAELRVELSGNVIPNVGETVFVGVGEVCSSTAGLSIIVTVGRDAVNVKPKLGDSGVAVTTELLVWFIIPQTPTIPNRHKMIIQGKRLKKEGRRGLVLGATSESGAGGEVGISSGPEAKSGANELTSVGGMFSFA